MKKYVVIRNTYPEHNFEIGTTVEYVAHYLDGTLCVKGKLKYAGNESEKDVEQDVHPRDLQEVTTNE